jgi:hypothetical protein
MSTSVRFRFPSAHPAGVSVRWCQCSRGGIWPGVHPGVDDRHHLGAGIGHQVPGCRHPDQTQITVLIRRVQPVVGHGGLAPAVIHRDRRHRRVLPQLGYQHRGITRRPDPDKTSSRDIRHNGGATCGHRGPVGRVTQTHHHRRRRVRRLTPTTRTARGAVPPGTINSTGRTIRRRHQRPVKHRGRAGLTRHRPRPPDRHRPRIPSGHNHDRDGNNNQQPDSDQRPPSPRRPANPTTQHRPLTANPTGHAAHTPSQDHS